MKTFSLLALLVLLALADSARAHAAKISVKVVDVSLSGDEYILKLDPQNEKNLSKRMIVHLRFNPKKAASAASSSRKDFDSAIKALEEAAAKTKPISIGLMSGTGFNPIKGQPGHFRSEMIQLVNWFEEPDVVCFFHSDHYSFAPK